jgi:hypothetical protein
MDFRFRAKSGHAADISATTERGLPTPNGAKWHAQTVRRMIDRIGS